MDQQQLYQKAKNTQMLLLDVDGVLTDGSLFFDHHFNEVKSFNAQDGLGLQMIRHQANIEVAVISGRKSSIVEHRLQQLGLKHVYLGVMKKCQALEDIQKKTNIATDAMTYVGDDLIDIPVMKKVGLAIATANATSQTKDHAHWVTQKPGGLGAVREVCDILLDSKGLLEQAWQQFQ